VWARRNAAFAELRRCDHGVRSTMRSRRALFRECSKVFHAGQHGSVLLSPGARNPMQIILHRSFAHVLKNRFALCNR
jgi:hypothetical protein